MEDNKEGEKREEERREEGERSEERGRKRGGEEFSYDNVVKKSKTEEENEVEEVDEGEEKGEEAIDKDGEGNEEEISGEYSSEGVDEEDFDDDEEFGEGEEEGEEDGEEGEEEQGEGKVWVIKCAGCGEELSERGMKVRLCADERVELYSTDAMITSAVKEEGEEYKIETCCCMIRSTHCARCSLKVGYHVVKACLFCEYESDSNTHYWLFNLHSSLSVLPIPLLKWAHLNLNHFPEYRIPLVRRRSGREGEGGEGGDGGGEEEEVEEELTCSICGGMLYQPVRMEGCGHVYCRGCISHEVDSRKACPLDRLPLTYSSFIIANDIQERLDRIEVHCRYACERDDQTMTWHLNPQRDCKSFVTFGTLFSHPHYSSCPFRPPSS